MNRYVYGSMAALQRATLRELRKADPGAEYMSFMGVDSLRSALWRHRGVQCPTLCKILSSADYFLVRAGCAPLNMEQVECLQDPAREYDALGMVDDLESRCDLPTDTADALREWIADRHHVNARG